MGLSLSLECEIGKPLRMSDDISTIELTRAADEKSLKHNERDELLKELLDGWPAKMIYQDSRSSIETESTPRLFDLYHVCEVVVSECLIFIRM